MEQIDYKELYEQAKERAKHNLTYAQVEEIFPEPESEDERISKELIEYIKDQQSSFISAPDCRDKYEEEENNKYNSWIAWLEKQAEQKPTLPKWKYKKDHTPLLRDSLILNKYGCVAKSPSGAIVSDVWVIDYDELAKLPKEEFEKQGEQILANSAKTCKDDQKPIKEHDVCDFCDEKHGCVSPCPTKLIEEEKPADKAEPKFKVGDWIIDNNIKTPFLITDISNEKYDVISIYGTDMAFSFREVEHFYHLWTIQDAKDGDVLYLQKDGKEHIIIYKGVIKERFRTFVSAYCAYNGIVDAFCFADVSRYVNIAYRGIMPATKEQREQLEKAMADAGYTFDFEKKELKKIEQKPAEWSEEDENHVKSILSTIECCKAQFPNAKAVVEAYNADIDWLKSLKNRYTWMPSDLPHWKKSTLPDSNTTGFNSDYFCHKGYCINYKELFEKLPKDD